MKLTYTPFIDKKLVCPSYIITFDMEHGDADATTHETVTFTDVNKIEEYLSAVATLSELIDQERSGNRAAKQKIQTLIETCGFYIPCEYDCSYTDVHAGTGISKIMYIDENGAKFNVAVTYYD